MLVAGRGKPQTCKKDESKLKPKIITQRINAHKQNKIFEKIKDVREWLLEILNKFMFE